ncbi:MAG: NAD(P)H-binding protein [Marmoricola sp.]
MRIAVAGATGVVGAYVVEEARSRGHEVVPLARSLGLDVADGDGLDEALTGVDVVIDVLSTTAAGKQARAFFERTTTNLLRAEERAGVGHHLALSIVGIDGVPFGYYEAKVRQEELVEAGAVPWTILRATQFHEFAGQLLDRMGTRVVAPVPRMLSQPIAAVEVADALVDRAEAGPGGRVPELAGPEKRQMGELMRKTARARGKGVLVLPVPVPGAFGRAVRDGTLTPKADGPRGTLTFDAWLAGDET